MFKPLPMQHISLKVLTEDVPLAAQLLAECGVFNPETTEIVAEQLPERPGEDFRQVFNSAQSRLTKILARISFVSPIKIDSYHPVAFTELEQVNVQLGDIWQQLSQWEEQLHQLNEQQTTLSQLLETLTTFSGLDIDLTLFQERAQFLNVHIGTAPVENLVHLKEAIALAEHFMKIFHQDEHIASVVIAGPLDHQDKVGAILEHADFQPLAIPPEFHNHPQQVHADLTAQLAQLEQDKKVILAHEKTLGEQNQTILAAAYQILNRAAAYAQLTETLRGRGQLALVEGWIPRQDCPQLETTLHKNMNRPFVFTHRKPSPYEFQQVPSVIRHHRLLAPYIALVKNYGTPRYGEFDPTLLFTFTFIVMFGTMFGDVGHGALIAGAGWYWRDKLKTFTPFFLAAGMSSIFFGFLYGSIFGFEEVVLPALWLSPIHNPTLMLKLALYWGMGFILLATIITIFNRWQEGEYAAALFNSTGIVGILLYLGGYYAIEKWMRLDVFEIDQQLAIWLPLITILAYKWHENKMPFGERFLVTLIEGFEALLNYLANTLSFLRVAAFSLNHAALAIAVFTLANMMSSPADWLIIILGNLFIVGLEGAIVTIQVLRLEYYEGFSRFFSGDGRDFRPLTKGIH